MSSSFSGIPYDNNNTKLSLSSLTEMYGSGVFFINKLNMYYVRGESTDSKAGGQTIDLCHN